MSPRAPDRYAVAIHSDGRSWLVVDTHTALRSAWEFRPIYRRLTYAQAQQIAAWLNFMGFEPPANDT